MSGWDVSAVEGVTGCAQRAKEGQRVGTGRALGVPPQAVPPQARRRRGEALIISIRTGPGEALSRRWGGDRPDQSYDFSGLGVASQRLFREDAATVDLHFEHTARRLDQLYVGDGVGLADFGRQTGGSRLVVSDDAVFDRDAHA